MVLFSGVLPNATKTIATYGIIIQATSLIYNFPYALSLAVSTKVGNELGANRSDKAKASSFYALLCAFITTIVATILTVSMTYAYGQMSIEYEAILSLTATTLPIVGRELLGAPSNYVNGQNCPCLKNVIFNCGRTFFRAISRKNFFRRKPRKKVLPQLKITTTEEPASI